MTGWLLAHGLGGAALRNWTVSAWEPFTISLLLGSAALYAIGVREVWRRAGTGQGIRRWEAAAFVAALASIAVALLSPLAWLSSALFSAHMTQHEILMLLSAPLLVFGRPLQACLWAFDAPRREAIGRLIRRPAVASTWHAATGPVAVFAMHAAALWIWHVPALYGAALANEAVHALQHFSFLATAALFWWGMIYGRYGRLGYGAAVLYVFLTAVHSSILGALLTIAPAVWYPAYLSTGAEWRIDALADQQLAGLLMWVPSGLVFIAFGLALFAAWLGESERRVRLALPRKLVLILLLVASGACARRNTSAARELTGGDPDRGIAAIGRYGCGSCHEIPGVRRATGTVGPPLTRIAMRSYLGGRVSNTPADMIRWIQHPQQIERGTAMPDMNVTDTDARDIAAYLYTLR